jgi:hypothetical protein
LPNEDRTFVEMDLTLPPLDKIALALRAATELLARELTVSSEHPPAWDDFEWCIAKAVATMQGIAPLLAESSRWRVPKEWCQFIAGQREHVAARQTRISHLMREIDLAARGEGIFLLPLKGAALHSMGIYKCGQRPMADIDLLVRADSANSMARLLNSSGFRVTFTNWRHLLLELRVEKNSAAAFGEHADNPIKIELHTAIRERLPVREIDITDFIVPRAPEPGFNDYRSPAALMAHLLLHAAGNMRARALRLIQLHDIALLSARFTVGDWEELATARLSNQSPWWAAAPLLLTSRYYPDSVPAFVVAELEGECPRFLAKIARRQRISDVSWSNLKVYAFPGIEWSKSAGEALRFMAGRLWPGRDVRAELHRFAEHEQRQSASSIPWYGISQAQRILRWVFSRPPRVQTLQVVRAALNQPVGRETEDVAL